MKRYARLCLWLAAQTVVLVVPAMAADPMASGMARNVGVYSYMGYQLVPAPQAGTRFIVGDEAPAQMFELVRPADDPVTLGRIFTSCSCIQVEAPKRFYEPGERIFLTLRNIRPTPPAGQMYAFYVHVTSPVSATLRQDLFLQSDRFRRPQPVVQPEARRGAW